MPTRWVAAGHRRLNVRSSDWKRRPYEPGVIVDVADQPVLVLPHAEEVVCLGDPLDGPPAIGTAATSKVLLGPEPLVGHAVPAHVLAEVDVSPVPQPLKHRLHEPGVPWLSGADEVVVRYVQVFPRLLEPHDHAVRVGPGVDAVLEGGVPHLLAVLVCAGQQEDAPALEPAIPGRHVRQDRRVCVADMRLVVDVVDRSGDVEVVRHGDAPV